MISCFRKSGLKKSVMNTMFRIIRDFEEIGKKLTSAG